MRLALLWEITLGSWLTAALILLVRLLFGRWLSARGKYLLWLPLLLRLLLPFTPPSPTSLINLLPETVSGGAYLSDVHRAVGSEEAGEIGPVPVTGEREGEGGLRPWLLRIWLTGAAAVLLFHFLLYGIGAKAMSGLPLCTDPETRSELLRLRQLTGIDGSLRMAWGSAGMLGGLLRTTLVLPVERRKEAAAPIMLHELMHQRSRHLWLGLLLRLLSAVYWFNPVVWLCLPLVRQDCEELCDEMVLDTGLIEAREYTSVLYSEGGMNGLLSPLPRTNFGGRRGSLCRRIGRIARRREGRESRFLPIFLVLCILLCGTAAPLAKGAPMAETADPIPLGYETMDAYLKALQPDLGRFGATFWELEAEGFFREAKDLQYRKEELTSTVSLRRMLYGAERELNYSFFLSPFSGAGEEQVLYCIMVYPTEEELDHGFELFLEGEILEGWRTLPESGERGRSIAPVDGRTILGDSLCDRAAEFAQSVGWTEDREEYRQRMADLPAAWLTYNRNANAWILYGLGMALYETRPTE